MNISTKAPTGRAVGSTPLFRQLADDIGLVRIVNQMLRWDERQSHTSPGERVLLLVLDVLSGKSPLYRMTERLQSTDVEVLIGAGRKPTDFSDDSLGRALDKLGRAEPAKVFGSLALSAYTQEGITLGAGHWDSTSRTLYGQFDNAPPEGIRPAYGHSKDYRPDLKQVLLTLFVNREGVPFVGTVESGNRSDKTLNGEMIDRLTEALAPEQLQHLIYVADSALITRSNLARLVTQNIQFVSRCPDTFSATSQAKTTAWETANWQQIGAVAERLQAVRYEASEQTGTLGDHLYRLVVYRSDAVDARRVHAGHREISHERTRVERSAHLLTSQTFACEVDAQQALQQWRRENQVKWHRMTSSVHSHTKQTRPGRPRKTPDFTDTTTRWRVTLGIEKIDGEVRQRELERRSTFVLITTVPPAQLSAAQLLREYKGQVHVERHFHFVKDPLFVDALFVKKPERVEALGYVLLLACLLYSLVERRLRLSEIPIPSPSRRVLKRPTAHEVVRHLESLQVMHTPSGERVIALPTILHKTLETIFQALDMSVSIFTVPPSRDPPTTQ